MQDSEQGCYIYRRRLLNSKLSTETLYDLHYDLLLLVEKLLRFLPSSLEGWTNLRLDCFGMPTDHVCTPTVTAQAWPRKILHDVESHRLRGYSRTWQVRLGLGLRGLVVLCSIVQTRLESDSSMCSVQNGKIVAYLLE